MNKTSDTPETVVDLKGESAPKPQPASRLRWGTLAIGLSAAGLAIWVLFEQREHLHSDRIGEAIQSISATELFVAAFATALSFVTLAFMEWLGARACLGQKRSFGNASLFSLIIYGISNTFGLAGLASTPLRLRLYSVKNGKDDESAVPTEKILSLCLLASAAFWIGLAFLLGLSLIGCGFIENVKLPLGRHWLFALGSAILLASFAACWLIGGRGAKIFGDMHLALPGFRHVLIQSALASLDWALAGIALYALLPSSVDGGIVQFFAGFLISQVAALVSSIPGGIGVLEGFSVYLMDAPKAALPQLAASFIAYRGIYYLPPLLISFGLFALWNLKYATGAAAKSTLAIARAFRSSVPFVASALTGLFGFALLLNSGRAVQWMVETSALPDFWESLIGTALLILAIGVYERGSSARKATLVTMVALAGIFAARGPAWSALLVSSAIGALLLFSEKEFYRKSDIALIRSQQRFSLLVLIPSLASMILAIVVYFRNEIDSQQWWTLTFDSEASAVLRGCVGSLVALGAYGLWALFSPRGRSLANPGAIEPSVASRDLAAIQASPFTTSCLALVGDKDIFRVDGIDGLIMYKVVRPFWVSMGEPVCAPANARALMTAFLAECDRHGGVPVFYQTRPETLALYVDVGFQAVKIGEEARVLLPEFSLEGRKQKSMRNTCSRIEREGYRFALLSKETVVARMNELREISNQWLDTLSMREKGFSIGFFKDQYIAQNDVAAIMKEDKIVAFANIWLTGSRHEFSVDLMRYGADAPSGVMEYLVIQLMLHAKSEGYNWFNLGMAPLAGLEGIHSGRQWHRVGSMIYRAGEAFYNFRGLKAFKDKFGPTWESRFLVFPPGSNLARILSSVVLLINFRGARQGARENTRREAS